MPKPLYLLLFVLLCTSISCGSNQKPVDLLILNARFYNTENEKMEVADISIRDENIVKIDRTVNTSLQTIKRAKRVIDAQELFVFPGFIDAHLHMKALGESKQQLNLMKTKTWGEIVDSVASRVAQAKPDQWIVGRGWHQEKWEEMPSQTVYGFPVHDELSKISPNNPVILSHASGHAIIANQAAMDAAGVTASTASPVGGEIIKNSAGMPTGVFQENAEELIVKSYQDKLNERNELEQEQDWRKTIRLAQQECLKYGITGVHDAGISMEEYFYYSDFDDLDSLNVRVNAMLSASELLKEESNSITNWSTSWGNSSMFECKSVKAYVDGALGSRGAWLIHEYSDQPGYYGEKVISLDSLESIANRCFDDNLQLCVHAIGDRGNREVISIYANHLKDTSNNLRWRIEHAQHIQPEDIDRMVRWKIIASMQTIHCTSDSPFVEKRLGKQRAEEGAYVWKSMLDKGLIIANGTDAPVESVNPFENMYAAVTRKRIGSSVAFYPQQVMTRAQMLKSYTYWPAYAAFQNQDSGAIKPSNWADLVILDTDLFSCTDEEILQTKVMYTIVNGKIQYESTDLENK